MRPMPDSSPQPFTAPALSRRCGRTALGTLLALTLAANTIGHAYAQDSDWPRHGRDAAETRFSPLDQINTGNVDRLQVAWSWEIPKTGARLETTPLVVDGVLYGTGALSFVFALDAVTGEELWRWDPAIPDAENGGPRACCGDVNRGVALHDDQVFVGLLDGRLVALDRTDGSVRWATQTTPPGSDYTITGAPRIVGNSVVIGNGGAEYGVRGYVTAYDVESGAQLWRTHTVPGNPADGFESDAMRSAAETWTGEWWIAGGGGTVWDAMAVDADADLLYVGTGNGSPWNRDNRSPGGGDNLYLSTILALEPGDGTVRWHYQTTPGDDWDYTATQPLILLDLEIGGRERKVVVQAPKNGFFYVVDRITGELVSAEPFADDLTWATEVDPQSGRPVETPEARYGMTGKPVYLAPGPRGAHNWHTMSWNPGTGLVYIPATNNNYWYEKSPAFDYQQGIWNTGTVRENTGRRPPRPELKGPPNLLLAWDPAENREAWRVAARGRHGGTASTAGGLVFWGTGSRLAALDARTGEELWSGEVGRGASSPVTYAVDGRQYVSVAAGLISGGGAPRVWTFALDEGETQQWTTAAPETVGLSGEGLGAIGPTHATAHRPRGHGGHHDLGGAARRDRALGRPGLARPRSRPPRTRRYLPHLLHDQTRHERRGDDAGRGRAAVAGRRARELDRGLRRCPGVRGRGHASARPSHPGPRPPLAHLGAHVRVLRRQPRRLDVQPCAERAFDECRQRRGRRGGPREEGRNHCVAPARRRSGRTLDLH